MTSTDVQVENSVFKMEPEFYRIYVLVDFEFHHNDIDPPRGPFELHEVFHMFVSEYYEITGEVPPAASLKCTHRDSSVSKYQMLMKSSLESYDMNVVHYFAGDSVNVTTINLKGIIAAITSDIERMMYDITWNRRCRIAITVYKTPGKWSLYPTKVGDIMQYDNVDTSKGDIEIPPGINDD